MLIWWRHVRYRYWYCHRPIALGIIQLYIACSVDDAASALSILESCLASLHSWFCHNGLALNPSKSEAILLGTRQRLSSFPIPIGIQTANSSVPISDHITTLGVTLDSNLTLNGHVSSVCKSSYYSIKALPSYQASAHTRHGQSCRNVVNTDSPWLC